MISAFLLLLCNSLFLSLHLSGGTGSFPKPLTAAQEREYLRRCGWLRMRAGASKMLSSHSGTNGG